MNEFYKLAQVDGIDWNKIKEVASYDDRIGMTHMDVPGSDGNYGWGGACFPKDVSAIISEAKSCGLNLKLLENVVNINKEHRNND